MARLDRENPSVAIPQLDKMIADLDATLVDRFYPVGTYYFTAQEDYNPAFLGGEWELENNTSPYRWRRTR